MNIWITFWDGRIFKICLDSAENLSQSVLIFDYMEPNSLLELGSKLMEFQENFNLFVDGSSKKTRVKLKQKWRKIWKVTFGVDISPEIVF